MDNFNRFSFTNLQKYMFKKWFFNIIKYKNYIKSIKKDTQ